MNSIPAGPPTITGTPSLSVRTLRLFDEVEELRSVWEKWQSHPNSDIDYYLSRFPMRPEFLQPHVLVVLCDGRPDAMLVGRLDDLRLDLKIGYVHWLRPRARVLNFIYSGLLGNQSSDNCKVMINALMRSLQNGEADLVAFTNVPLACPLYVLAQRSPKLLVRDHFPEVNLHCGMTLPRNVEEIYRGLPPKVRKNLKWQAKQLLKTEALNVRVECFCGIDEVERMIGEVEEVARKTYQRGLGVGFADNPEMRNRLSLGARKGWMRTYVLYLENKPSAFCVGTLYDGTYHTDFVGYDPHYAKYSPGTFLLMTILEELCNQGIRGVDFGYGVEGYKQRFGDSKWHEAMVRIYAPTARGLALKLLTALTLLTDRLARKILDQINVLPILKKLWRKRVTNCAPDASRGETASEA